HAHAPRPLAGADTDARDKDMPLALVDGKVAGDHAKACGAEHGATTCIKHTHRAERGVGDTRIESEDTAGLGANGGCTGDEANRDRTQDGTTDGVEDAHSP